MQAAMHEQLAAERLRLQQMTVEKDYKVGAARAHVYADENLSDKLDIDQDNQLLGHVGVLSNKA